MTHTSLKKSLTMFFVTLVIALACLKTSEGQNCVDSNEPNDSRQVSVLIQPVLVYHGTMGSALDIDWFKFKVTISHPNVRVTLFDLPANYNLFLYNPHNVKIGSSKNKNAGADTVTANELDSGTYYIKIRAKAGKYDPAHCYSLKVETNANPYRQNIGDNDFTILDSGFELYPNPAIDQLNIQYDQEIGPAIFAIYNLIGQKISETNVMLDGQSRTALDVKELGAGEYFLQIRYNKGSEVKKFVVSK